MLKTNEYISACPNDQIRFADHCYDELLSEIDNILANADNCELNGGHLWYPETAAEIAFIIVSFPTDNSSDVYHLGIDEFSHESGINFTDGTFSPGLPFYTSNYTKRNGRIFHYICFNFEHTFQAMEQILRIY